jgi:hypothetical protein
MKYAGLQWESHTSCLKEEGSTVHKKCLVEKLLVKMLHGRPRQKERYMKIDFREITYDDKLD